MNAPLLILAAGQRCGSTLVQRLLSSHPDVLIWGEHAGQLREVLAVAERLGGWTAEFGELGRLGYARSGHQSFMANMTPEAVHIDDAVRAFLEALFAEPAAGLGRPVWGFKEVRYGLAEASRLSQGSFPDCRVVHITREPARHPAQPGGVGARRVAAQRHRAGDRGLDPGRCQLLVAGRRGAVLGAAGALRGPGRGPGALVRPDRRALRAGGRAARRPGVRPAHPRGRDWAAGSAAPSWTSPSCRPRCARCSTTAEVRQVAAACGYSPRRRTWPANSAANPAAIRRRGGSR